MSYYEAVLEIYLWQYNNTYSFYNLLVLCIQKADHNNRWRIGMGFSDLVKAFEDWEATDHIDDLFKAHLKAEDVKQHHKEWFK